MNSRRILLHGCYHTRNFGDLLIAELLCGYIEKLLGYPPTSIDLNTDAQMGTRCRPGAKLAALLPAAAAILGGGGYLNNQPDHHSLRRLSRYSLPARIWRYTGVPYIITGVGVGPSYTSRGASKIRYICDGAREVLVRDDESVELLLGMGVSDALISRCADLALVMSANDIPQDAVDAAKKLLPARSDSGRRLCLHIQSVQPRIQQEIYHRVCYGLGRAFTSGEVDIAIIFDHGCSGYDDACALAREHPGRVRVIPPQPIWTTAALLTSCDAALTTKLHIGIVSWALGVVPFGISIHPKTRRFFQQIHREDFQWNIFDGIEDAPIIDWMRLVAQESTAFLAEDPSVRGDLIGLAGRGYDAIRRLLLCANAIDATQ